MKFTFLWFMYTWKQTHKLLTLRVLVQTLISFSHVGLKHVMEAQISYMYTKERKP